MANFVDYLASTVIFLFTENGEDPMGTAFIIGYPVPNESSKVVPLVVTAKHVLGNRNKIVGRFSTQSGEQTAGVLYDLEHLHQQEDVWEHSDDGVDLVVF